MVTAPNAQKLALLALTLREIHNQREILLSQIAGLDSESHAVQLVEYNTILNQTSAIAKLPNELIAYIFKTVHNGEHVTRPELLVSQDLK